MTLAHPHHTRYLINGATDTKLTPLDRGLAYGDGVFRTLKIINGRPVAWTLHYSKLVHDCNRLGIVCPAENLFLTDIDTLFAPDETAVAKLMVTRGESARGYALPVLAQPTRITVRSDYPEYPDEHYAKGVRLHLCNLRLSRQPLLAGIKHLNRLENVLARSEWSDPTIADGLLLDDLDRVIACTMSNVFARYDQRLVTPSMAECGVAGTTRQRLLESAGNIGLITEVVELSLTRLLEADEILICNSLFGVWQVVEFNHQHWPTFKTAQQLRALIQE